ncbi:recombinase family protein [Magnetococcus sp. PR-3]|uniref:recombinase family protein n=1 Tax=Magnetococcus sp. PR-3 TaxID=3120355 RepID=UPI002FCE4FD5
MDTQSFNTANSMGRLTLNMLLSFAQYEREVTAERIRDKYAASRKRGIWMGGHPPLGYDEKERKLAVNPKEAGQVRQIFKRFTQIGSATLLIKELTEKGIVSKIRQLSDGRIKGGKPIDKGTLYKILNNRVYLGEVAFRGEVYPGEHAPIIEQDLWDKVQSILKKNKRSRSNNSRNQSPAPLKGIIRCGHCNRAMRPTHTRKNGVQYRYYLCMTASKNSHADCPLASVSAPQVDEGVFKRVRQIIQTPEIITRVWRQAAHTDPDIQEQDVTMALKKINPIWDELFPIEQNRLLSLLVENVILTTTSMEVRVRVDGITSLVAELSPTPQT